MRLSAASEPYFLLANERHYVICTTQTAATVEFKNVPDHGTRLVIAAVAVRAKSALLPPGSLMASPTYG